MSNISFEGEVRDSKPYFRPVSDGKIVRKITKEEYERRVTDPSQNVRAREWATPKESGIVYEETYDALSGRIVAVNIRDHETYGRSIAVTLRQNSGAEGVFTASTDSQYGMTLMERLPNVDIDEIVRISAYVKESGDKKRYTTFMTQRDARVDSFFKAWDDENKKFVLSHGYPEVSEKEKQKFGDKYWSQRYFPECSVFLVEYIETNVAPKVNEMVQVVTPQSSVADKDDITLVPDEAF